MKPGTIIELPDGRRGTVVYHGLDGYGIQWGEVDVDADAILAGAPLFERAPLNWKWEPEAMLRESHPSAGVECVGDNYMIVKPTPATGEDDADER